MKMGFPLRQVFKHFLFGFPPHWEDYAGKCFEGDSTSGFISRKNAKQCAMTMNEASHGSNEDVPGMNLGLESSRIVKEQSKLHLDTCNESPSMVGKEGQQKNVANSVICDQEGTSSVISSLVSTTTMVEKSSSENVVHPSPLQNPCGASSSSTCGVGLEGTKREYSLTEIVDESWKPLRPYDCARENQDERNMNGSPLTTSAPSGKKELISEEIPCQSDGEVSKCQSRKPNSKSQEGQVTIIGLKNKRERFTSIPVDFGHVNSGVESIDLEIGGESMSNLADVGIEEHHNITVEKLDDKCLKDGSQRNSKFTPAYPHAQCKQNHEHIVNQAGIHVKNRNESVRCSSSVGKANQKADPKAAAERASSSGKKTVRKSDYSTQVTLPSIKEGADACTVSPKLLNLKRSRSGRLLLPSLDFWRNQTAVYDADRRVTGIQEGLHLIRPLRDRKKRPPK